MELWGPCAGGEGGGTVLPEEPDVNVGGARVPGSLLVLQLGVLLGGLGAGLVKVLLSLPSAGGPAWLGWCAGGACRSVSLPSFFLTVSKNTLPSKPMTMAQTWAQARFVPAPDLHVQT